MYNVREQTDEEPEDLPVYNVGFDNDEVIRCHVGGVQIDMLVDSGSKHNLIDDTTWELMKLRDVNITNERLDSDKRFLAYGRIPLKLLTTFDAKLEVDDNGQILRTTTTFYVIEKGQQPLLGKQTAQKLGILKIGLPSTHSEVVRKVDRTSKAFPKIRGIKLNIPVDRTVPPIIQPLRRCPIPLLDKVEEKLNELLKMDIIERVTRPTSWVSPLVPILKDNGELRLCIDMRRANQAIQRLNHPLPVFEDLVSRFRNAKFFTTLDIKQAFHQVELSEDCRDVTTFITNWGLFRYKRLLFGVNCAPELYQNLMESILVGCKNSVVFIDDILIFGATEEDHDAAVKQVLQVLHSYDILLNDHKCLFKQREVDFLGHKLSADGVSPSEVKIKAIQACRAPNTKEELRSFLGLVTYVSRFIPDLTTVNYPLRQLLKMESSFEWRKDHQVSFDKVKALLGSAESLGYYDPKDRTLVVTDASAVGLGAVLIQFKNCRPRVISFASKSLTNTEKAYPPIEKEALGIVWAVERFKIYLLGIIFELETDHRPLETLFSTTSKPTARIERWLLRLQAFKFKVVYRKGSANLADCLSRLASHVEDPNWTEESEVYIRRAVVQSISSLSAAGNDPDFDAETEDVIRAIQESAAIDISEVISATEGDKELQILIAAITGGNWDKEELKPYKPFRLEFSYINKLIMRGTKLVIPSSLRSRMCELAHEGHPGQSMMKRRLRERCWWPGVDRDAVKTCDRCEGCRLVQASDPPEPMTRRLLPEKPWIDIAIDFLGPMPTGHYLLVVIDYYSRYMEVEIMTRITAQETINRLKRIFRTWGAPRTITLDNAKQFVSSEFKDFCNTNCIHLNHTSPYWPQANGEVERQNRSLLKRMKISHAIHEDWKVELDQYLNLYNNNPHTTTGKPPSELLQGRKLRSKLPQLEDLASTPPCTDFRDQDTSKKMVQKEREDETRRARPSDISVGDIVLLKNLLPSNKLSTNFLKEKFTVVDRNGSNVTIQSQESGKTYDRNVVHLKKCEPTVEYEMNEPENALSDTDSPNTESPGDAAFPEVRRSSRAPKPVTMFSPSR